MDSIELLAYLFKGVRLDLIGTSSSSQSPLLTYPFQIVLAPIDT